MCVKRGAIEVSPRFSLRVLTHSTKDLAGEYALGLAPVVIIVSQNRVVLAFLVFVEARRTGENEHEREQKRTYDVLQLGASGASTLKRGTRGSLPQTAHGPAAEASSSAASSSSVVGGGGGDGS